jgi:hypothetical protein
MSALSSPFSLVFVLRSFPPTWQIEDRYGWEYFNYPQDDEPEDPDEDDEESDLPHRNLCRWRLFRKVPSISSSAAATATESDDGTSYHPHTHGGRCFQRMTLSPESELPADDDMKNYVLVGWLVAPDGTKVRIRLDQLETLYFDVYPTRLGWWVEAHNGKDTTAYYRLLEPDNDPAQPSAPEEAAGLSRPSPRDGEPHLERRAMQAILSGVIAVCDRDTSGGRREAEEATSSASDNDDEEKELDLGPFIQRMKLEGIDVLPILRVFAPKIARYLNCRLTFWDGRPCRFAPVIHWEHVDFEVGPEPSALLDATVAAERISGHLPWGVMKPAPLSRKRPPPGNEAVDAKKQRIDPISPQRSPVPDRVPSQPHANFVSSNSETTSENSESSESSSSTDSNDRRIDRRTRVRPISKMGRVL